MNGRIVHMFNIPMGGNIIVGKKRQRRSRCRPKGFVLQTRHGVTRLVPAEEVIRQARENEEYWRSFLPENYRRRGELW